MDYIQSVKRSECPIDSAVLDRFGNEKVLRLIHACLGMTTEVGEFVDQLKKHLFYGKELDFINLDEELGDLLWYIAVALDCLGLENFEATMKRNIAKLASRYPHKFSTDEALLRDLQKEWEVLEKGWSHAQKETK